MKWTPETPGKLLHQPFLAKSSHHICFCYRLRGAAFCWVRVWRKFVLPCSFLVFLILRAKKEIKMEIRTVKARRVTLTHICTLDSGNTNHLFIYFWSHTCASAGRTVWGSVHTGALSDTRQIDIVFGKKIGVTQNTEHYVIMLLVSVCQYDLARQSLLSGVIACTTFRRLCMRVPIRFEHFWTGHGRCTFRAVSVPVLSFSLPSISPSNRSIIPCLYENLHSFPYYTAASEVPASRQSLPTGVWQKSFHLLTIISLTQSRPKSFFFFFPFFPADWNAQEQRWSSEARVKDPMWLRSDSFNSLISTSEQKKELLYIQVCMACIQRVKPLIKWHTVIKTIFYVDAKQPDIKS